jgi:FAD/FMN-containing dehydrogenase
LDASPGVIAIQTAAGAISTGTHGQGLFQSTLADAVVKMTIVTPKGKLI